MLNSSQLRQEHGALLVVDMQKGYLEHPGRSLTVGSQELILRVNALMEMARRANWAIVHVLETIEPFDVREYCIEELLAGFAKLLRESLGDNHPMCDVHEGDFILGRKMFTGFDRRGSLLHLLTALRTNAVGVCGVKTGICVLDTAEYSVRIAGFPTEVHSNCTAERNTNLQEASLEEMRSLGIRVR